ncbi:MAG: pantoate--beta-alanine ligase [Chitinophagaceae bacterium]
MVLFKKKDDLANYLELQRKEGKKYGLIPTMGALHMGHISLISNSKKSDDLSVSCIFVNPIQFNNQADYEKYPVTLEKDIAMLEEAGCDILFLPSITEIYPEGIKMTHGYDLGYLETVLEGQYRPGHFQGVCNVVHRLLDTIKPDTLYLGQKDYQQCLVVKKLIELIGMEGQIGVDISPTVREENGLAMSSRNMRLNEKEKINASGIYHALQTIKDQLQVGELMTLKTQTKKNLEKKGFRIDYVEIADACNLKLVENWNGKQKLVALAAAYLNQVRLIDNILLDRSC